MKMVMIMAMVVVLVAAIVVVIIEYGVMMTKIRWLGDKKTHKLEEIEREKRKMEGSNTIEIKR